MGLDDSNNSRLISIGVIVVVIAAVIAVLALAKEDSSVAETTATPTVVTTGSSSEGSSTTASSEDAPTPAASYRNGTYAATGTYTSPGGSESIKVELTLQNDVVTAATVTSLADNPTTKQYQGQFISGFKSVVVGKNIDNISLTRVSGSSLTPKGFNNALATIKEQAEI